ncbi:MAG: NAD-dependent epimerase/dehydratase family protein [Bacteroidetes bacterium]|nr:NAD-dependent epimerase/dehydratase family protein [Bacteroidota bacterium]
MPSKIAVTGASGHIGNVICRSLIERGYQVRAMYHSDNRSLSGLNLEMVKGSVLSKDDLSALVEGCETVINCAAIISINGDENGFVFKTNTEGPGNVLSVSLKKRVRKIIHVSSVHAVHDLPHSIPYDESRSYKTSDNFVYDYSKAMGEQIILKESENKPIEVVIVRPSSVIGPFDFKPSKIGKALMDFYHGKMPVVPSGGYDFVDVRDVSESICNAILKGQNREVYLLSGKYCSFEELLQLVYKITQRKMPGIVVPFWFLKASVPFVKLFSKLTNESPSITYESISAIKEGHPEMNNSKARKALGHDPRPLKESLQDFFEWMYVHNVSYKK